MAVNVYWFVLNATVYLTVAFVHNKGFLIRVD